MFAREESYSEIRPDPEVFEGTPRRRLDPRRIAEMLSGGEPSAEPDSSVGRREFEPPPVARRPLRPPERAIERATDLSCAESVEPEDDDGLDSYSRRAFRPRRPPVVVLPPTPSLPSALALDGEFRTMSGCGIGFGAAFGKQTNPNIANTKFRPAGRPTAERPPGSPSCLARALPGRKISLQSAAKPVKTAPVSNVVYGDRSRAATPVKIIQPGRGAIPFRAGVSAKSWSQSSSDAIVKPFAKNAINVHKISKATHLSSASIVTFETSHFDSRQLGNRQIGNYAGTENNNLSYAQSNKDITAQILKHLAPVVQQIPGASVKRPPAPHRRTSFEANAPKKCDQRRQIHGDPNTTSSSDDVGADDRPASAPESRPFRYRHGLQSIMLDHTYAVSTKTVSDPTANGTGPPVGDPAPSSPSGGIIPPLIAPVEIATLKVDSPPVDVAVSTRMAVPAPSFDERSVAPVSTGYRYDASRNDEEDTASVASSADDDVADGRHDSDTETAPEGEEEGKTRCVCEFTHDDGYMICCDRCGEWQHVDCMGIDRQNIPDDYMCDRCQPRSIDRKRARSVQIRKREELTGVGSSGSDSSSGASAVDRGSKQTVAGIGAGSNRKRPLTVTTYSNTVGGVSRTVPSSGFSPPRAADSAQPQPKRGPKRPRKVDNGRKGPKRRIPEKRKRKSGELSNYRAKFCSPSSNRANQWTETYESAMTNHYSPELRAKIARYCSNGGVGHGDSGMALTVHSCTTVPHAGGKILIATADMKENTPVIELRGKYMLSTQHKPSPQASGRVGSQRPGPFLFFYRLPGDSAQICIDTRTYGNEARFVRRSCKPNAELRHCIVKGALHVYLVTVAPVQSNTEISIRHETAGGSRPCACGNPKRCERNSPASPVSLGNDGPATDGADERKGRARLASSSSVVDSFSPTVKYEDDYKTEDRDADFKTAAESEPDVVKSEICESKPLDAIEERAMTEIEPVEPSSPVAQEPEEEVKVVEVKLENDLSEDEPLKPKAKDENSVDGDVPAKECVVAELTPVEAKEEEDEEESTPNSIESKSIAHGVTKSKSSSAVREKDEKPRRTIGSRRSSVQPARTTRASSAVRAGESADEKSDNQSDSKGSHAPKDKKKMTREERKMEAIMKAFERMEKAELRKQENKDRQTRRRESDPQQPNCDSKDQLNDEDDSTDRSSVKRRRRKKGRTRSTSNNHQSGRNRNRLNSVDSDMVTSGEESVSLLSPPLPHRASSIENYSDVRIDSSETSNFHDDVDTIRLQRSVTRLNMGLSSACLLVEAAVGPLESTFKFPKTKKDMMNEWLSKSPEQTAPYDTNHAMEYSNASDNNNTSALTGKTTYAGEKFENLMKAANTMIGNFSGAAIGAELMPEKRYTREPFRSDKPVPTYDSADSPLPSPTEVSPAAKSMKIDLDVNRDEKKIPKRYRKGLKSVIEEFTNKRALRSNAAVDNVFYADPVSEGNATPPPDGSFAIPSEVQEITTAPKPPQHSAKKRWLRQAISEESDSPTAESPPNEMVTPLKKRRLARESLSLERPFAIVSIEESNLTPTPTANIENPPQFAKSTEDDSERETLPKLSESRDEESPFDSSAAILKCDTPVEQVVETNAEIEASCKETSQIVVGEKDTTSVMEKSDSIIETSDSVKDDSLKISTADNSLSSNLELNIYDTSNDKDMNSFSVLKDNSRDISSFEKSPCKSESASNVNSTETSGNSSPVLDDIDDIKKKIHTFHTENIQILKIRNKKQPKEKRKKVNLNFDLCVLADQTVGVKLKSENDASEDDCDAKFKSEIGKDSEERSPVANLHVEATHSDSSNLSESNVAVNSCRSDSSKKNETISKGFMCTPLFTGESNSSNAQMPDLNVIKNAIDMTTSLEINIKSGNLLNKIDEYKNVQEILSRVKQMDSHNSVLLSGVLRDSNHSMNIDNAFSPSKANTWRVNDPRLNPPPVEKPKPVRRKLSITEYRRRHSMLSSTSGDQDGASDGACSTTQPSSSVSSNSSDSVLSLSIGEKPSDICRISESSIIESINESVSVKDEHLEMNFSCLADKPPPPVQFEKMVQSDGDPVRTPSPNANVASDDVSSQIKVTR